MDTRLDTPEPTVQREILVTKDAAPEKNDVIADVNDEEEESQATETEPTTHQLTHRSLEEDSEDKIDKWVSIK